MKPIKKPLVHVELTKEQFENEIQKGLDDIQTGNVYSEEEVKAIMNIRFGKLSKKDKG